MSQITIKLTAIMVGEGFVVVFVDFYTPIPKPVQTSTTLKRPDDIKIIIERHPNPEAVLFRLDRRESFFDYESEYQTPLILDYDPV